MRYHITAAALALTSSVVSPAAAGGPEQWYGADKAIHFSAGLALGAGGYGLGIAGFEQRWPAAGLGLGMGLGVGAAKEGLDAVGFGQPSWQDFAWTAIGAVIGVGLGASFDLALRGP